MVTRDCAVGKACEPLPAALAGGAVSGPRFSTGGNGSRRTGELQAASQTAVKPASNGPTTWMIAETAPNMSPSAAAAPSP